MSKYRDLDRGDVLPASWTDALQEFVSTLASNVDIQQTSATAIKVPASSGSGQVAIGIGGLWRYRSTDATASVPGSTPGTYDIFVSATANSFTNTPTPDIDNTDYNFALHVLAQGDTPSDGGIVAYRKIGELDYSGSTITFIRNTLDRGRTLHAASHEPGGDDELDWAAVKGALSLSVADLSEGSTGTGAVVRANAPTLTGTTTIATAAVSTFSGTPNFSGAATGQTAAVDDNTTKLATTAYVIGQGYLKSASASATYAPLASPSFTGQVKVPVGTVGAPGLVFSGDLNTGIYQTSADTLSIATGGNLAAQFGSSGNLNITGQYQVGGSQIAASNLSNGTTGTGAVVLAAGPTLTGTATIATAAITTLSGNPNFTGAPTAPTAAAGTNTTQLATTQFVARDFGALAVANVFTKAQSIAPDSDVVALTLRRGTDTSPTASYLRGRDAANANTIWSISAAGKASFIGLDAGSAKITAVANGSAADDAAAFGQIPLAATVAPLMDGAAAVGSSAKWAKEDHVHPIDTSRAPLASPGLTGTPTAPTASVDTSTTQIATTAFVIGQASASGDGTPAMDGTAARGTSTHFARADHVHPTDTSRQAAGAGLSALQALAGTGLAARTAADTWATRTLTQSTGITISNGDGVSGNPTIAVNTSVIATLASPTFTGTPAAPTAAADTNTTQIATTAFVLGQAATSSPLMDGAAAVGTSTRWARADHVHPSDTSRAALSGGNSFTGAQTITQSGDGLVLRSGGAASDILVDLGRTAQEVEIGIVGTAGNQFSGSAVGDLTIRQNGTSKAIRLGVATVGPTSAAELIITDGVVNATGTLQQGGTAVVLTNDARLSDSRAPNGAAGGDLSGTYPNPSIKSSVGLSGSPTATTAAADDSSTRIATTAFVIGQLATNTPLADASAGAVGTSTRAARADHVHPIPSDLGSNITAGTVTGINHRTSGSAGSSGAGIIYDATSFRAFNSTPNRTFEIEASSGKTVLGAGVADTTTQRMEADRTSLRFYGNSNTPVLTWTTLSVADPPGTGGTTSRGQLTTDPDTSKSRLWFDAKGLHAQLQNALLNGGTPFRTLDFDPASTLGLRLHSVGTTDILRVDPVNGTTMKLAAADDPGGDLGVRWVRQSDGTVAAKAWADNLGDDTIHGQYNAYAYAKAGGVSQTVQQSQLGTTTSPSTFAKVQTTANLSGLALTQALASFGAGSTYSVTLVRSDDGRSVLNYIEMFEQSSDPSAPAVNGVRFYARDNGSGKTQLCARFATGAIQVLATQP